MKKSLLLIPGFGESISDTPYQNLIKAHKQQYSVFTFTPKWNYSVPSDWLAELELMLSKIDTDITTVVSFSLGSYIALLAAQNYKFKKLILCSLSPFYSEQLSEMPDPAKVFFGKRRVNDFAKHKIPKHINKSSVVFLFGSHDWPLAIKEAKKLSKKYHGAFEIVPNTHHELTDEYLQLIHSYL